MKETIEHGLASLPDGGQLAYSILGKATSAPPILLNRPLGGSMTLWSEFAARLSRAFRVVAFDPRGVGKSSDVPSLHSTRKMARDALDLLNVLKVARVHVFGMSLGGLVASWMAIDAPQRVTSLILASTFAKVEGPPLRVARQAASLFRLFVRPGHPGEIGLVRETLSAQLREAHPDRVREIEGRIRAMPARRSNLLKLALASACFSGESELRRLHLPVLMLHGEWDRGAQNASPAELTRTIPGARVETIASSGQDVTLEQPIETADRILSFVRAAST